MVESRRSNPPERGTWRRKAVATLATTGVLLTGGAGATYIAEHETGAIARMFQPNPEDIPSEVPPLLRGRDIPTSNEHYQSPLAVVQTGIDAYIQEGGTPFYKRPSYYLSQAEIVRTFLFEQNPYDTSGKPYDDAVSFYEGAYFDPIDLYDDDPGTSSRIATERRLADVLGYTHPAETGPFGLPRFDAAQRTIINQTYAEQFSQTKHAIDEIRGSERASTSVLFTYNLHKNDGDITRSLLDTTLFIRFLARGDAEDMLTTETFFEAEADDNLGRQNAELLSSMFYDEFSPSVPLEWLIANVPADDPYLNVEDTGTNTQWKDFMPVNRAGTPYHIWSAIGMTTFMDPALVEEAVTRELNTSWPEHGRIKTGADIGALRQVREVRKVFEQYAVYG